MKNSSVKSIISKWEKPKEEKHENIKSIEEYTPETMEAGLNEVEKIVSKTGMTRKQVIELIVKMKAIKKFNVTKQIKGNS